MLYQSFTLSSGIGKAIYASYSDQELLDVLREAANRIGRAPTQGEIFSVSDLSESPVWHLAGSAAGSWNAAITSTGSNDPRLGANAAGTAGYL